VVSLSVAYDFPYILLRLRLNSHVVCLRAVLVYDGAIVQIRSPMIPS
jgi:hypothetical protein